MMTQNCSALWVIDLTKTKKNKKTLTDDAKNNTVVAFAGSTPQWPNSSSKALTVTTYQGMSKPIRTLWLQSLMMRSLRSICVKMSGITRGLSLLTSCTITSHCTNTSCEHTTPDSTAILWPNYIRNVELYFCPYLRQLMTDFQNSFTGTLCGQFAIMWLLYIPPHRKCVFTLPRET